MANGFDRSLNMNHEEEILPEQFGVDQRPWSWFQRMYMCGVNLNLCNFLNLK